MCYPESPRSLGYHARSKAVLGPGISCCSSCCRLACCCMRPRKLATGQCSLQHVTIKWQAAASGITYNTDRSSLCTDI